MAKNKYGVKGSKGADSAPTGAPTAQGPTLAERCRALYGWVASPAGWATAGKREAFTGDPRHPDVQAAKAAAWCADMARFAGLAVALDTLRAAGFEARAMSSGGFAGGYNAAICRGTKAVLFVYRYGHSADGLGCYCNPVRHSTTDGKPTVGRTILENGGCVVAIEGKGVGGTCKAYHPGGIVTCLVAALEACGEPGAAKAIAVHVPKATAPKSADTASAAA